MSKVRDEFLNSKSVSVNNIPAILDFWVTKYLADFGEAYEKWKGDADQFTQLWGQAHTNNKKVLIQLYGKQDFCWVGGSESLQHWIWKIPIEGGTIWMLRSKRGTSFEYSGNPSLDSIMGFIQSHHQKLMDEVQKLLSDF